MASRIGGKEGVQTEGSFEMLLAAQRKKFPDIT
jgi:hypothetical protein